MSNEAPDWLRPSPFEHNRKAQPLHVCATCGCAARIEECRHWTQADGLRLQRITRCQGRRIEPHKQYSKWAIPPCAVVIEYLPLEGEVMPFPSPEWKKAAQEARKKQGLTHQQIAAKANIAASHVSKLLSNSDHSVSNRVIREVSRALGLPEEHSAPQPAVSTKDELPAQHVKDLAAEPVDQLAEIDNRLNNVGAVMRDLAQRVAAFEVQRGADGSRWQDCDQRLKRLENESLRRTLNTQPEPKSEALSLDCSSPYIIADFLEPYVVRLMDLGGSGENSVLASLLQRAGKSLAKRAAEQAVKQ